MRQAIVRVSPPRVSTSASRLEPGGVDAGHQAHEREAGVEAIGGRHDGAEPVAPEQLVLVEAEQLAALAVDELDPARVVEDDHERAGDVQVALRAVALLAQAALGEDRPAHRRSSPCAHATAIGRRASAFIREAWSYRSVRRDFSVSMTSTGVGSIPRSTAR